MIVRRVASQHRIHLVAGGAGAMMMPNETLNGGVIMLSAHLLTGMVFTFLTAIVVGLI